VLGSGDGAVTDEGCEQDQPGADKSDHGCTIAEFSVGLFCTEDEITCIFSLCKGEIRHLNAERAPAGSFGEIMSFALYAIGYFILIIGLGYLAHLMHIPQHFIIAGVIIMAGIGVVTGVQSTRQKDPS
jgi:hypothetical protein